MTQQPAQIHFERDHPTAAGHFPGHPIIPGAVLLDEILRSFSGEPGFRPTIIRSAKFFRPVIPGETVSVKWQSQPAGTIKFECRLTGDDTVVAAGIFEIGPQPA